MYLLPAIDILGGKAVRLAKGDYNQVTVYNDDPVAQARAFEQAGAQWVHVVDLDGARSGVPENIDIVERIVHETSLSVEIGGGIRSLETLKRLADAGAARMVLISDSLRCCGMPDGEYELGGQQVFLKDGIARLADGTIAGSATNLYDCMLRAISFGIPREDAVRAATYNSARQIGVLDEVGSIRDGKVADFVLCDAELNRKAVYRAGNELK